MVTDLNWQDLNNSVKLQLRWVRERLLLKLRLDTGDSRGEVISTGFVA